MISFDEQLALYTASLAATNVQDYNWEEWDDALFVVQWQQHGKDRARRDRDRREYWICIHVDCPSCKVLAGDLCVNLYNKIGPSHQYLKTAPHIERLRVGRRNPPKEVRNGMEG